MHRESRVRHFVLAVASSSIKQHVHDAPQPAAQRSGTYAGLVSWGVCRVRCPLVLYGGLLATFG